LVGVRPRWNEDKEEPVRHEEVPVEMATDEKHPLDKYDNAQDLATELQNSLPAYQITVTDDDRKLTARRPNYQLCANDLDHNAIACQICIRHATETIRNPYCVPWEVHNAFCSLARSTVPQVHHG
jgi:hypothetical protein